MDADEQPDIEKQVHDASMGLAADFLHRVFLDVGSHSPEGFALRSALGLGREQNQVQAAKQFGVSREWLRRLERRIEPKLVHSRGSNGHRR